ncbi:MAG: hypothetical protein KDB22_19835 [Planctomycetales bacterium]|nr:hypothetical protein [Planctomycetales bacterium]MCA9184690.1 hypothetical protein [Planctomycetales bacterium]
MTISPSIARRIESATNAVFGNAPVTRQVAEACRHYLEDVANIEAGRGIGALLIAIVGAKGQGKTWVARQLIRDEHIKKLMPSGDLVQDATTRLVWVGPLPPDNLDPSTEFYHPCPSSKMIDIGQTYVLLDTPGLTDSNHMAAQLAKEALSLAPVKLLVIARDQIRAASNMVIAQQIEGSYCVPVISSVEPEEIENGAPAGDLRDDLRSLREQLMLLAPSSQLTSELLVPDFEISGNEESSSSVFVTGLLDRISSLGLTQQQLGTSHDIRLAATGKRLHERVHQLIRGELPQLATAVDQLSRETQQLPERVLASLLGSESLLETGVRMRLRARLVGDTSLLWFPYRTVMSTLNLTQGAWDRVMLALAGSVPSLFGALTSFARNVRQNRDFTLEIQEGIRQRTQQQVAERLQPLCDQFHRTVLKLRPREDRSDADQRSTGMRLSGIEELQTRSQRIFDGAIESHATPSWLVQVYALVGVLLFWMFMAGPVVVIYREYFVASYHVFSGAESHLDAFPHPTPGLLFTSVILSLLPLAVYCMLVLTWSLSRRYVRRVAKQVVDEHEACIAQLRQSGVIRLEFEDELLQQAEFLLSIHVLS